MKKLITAFICILFCASIANAKVGNFSVEYIIDQEFIEYIVSYNLYKEAEGSTIKELVGSFLKDSEQVLLVDDLDLPAGKVTNFYLEAVYVGGDLAMSEVFPFKYTGKPTIIRFTRR